MATARSGSSQPDAGPLDIHATLEELRDRNINAVAMDVLYLLTTAFFAHLLVRGFWAALIATVPLAALLYFGWLSSRPFFATQIAAIVAAIAATYAGLIPL